MTNISVAVLHAWLITKSYFDLKSHIMKETDDAIVLNHLNVKKTRLEEHYPQPQKGQMEIKR